MQPNLVVKHLKARNPLPLEPDWDILHRSLSFDQRAAWSEYKALLQRMANDLDNPSMSPWQFWEAAAQHEANHLHPMAAFAKEILSMSTTSCPVEGEFSTMNYFENTRRLCMSDESMIAEFMLSSNKVLLQQHIKRRLADELGRHPLLPTPGTSSPTL